MLTNFQQLIERATAGQNFVKNRLFSPSWFYYMLDDPFWVWCEYHAPRKERFDETTRFEKHQMQLGKQWEDRHISCEYPDTYIVAARWGFKALHETLSAMLRGESSIASASLWRLGDDVYGKTDLLVRCDDIASDLGGFHYRVKEIKNTGKVNRYHLLQAAVYHWILGHLQGFVPESFDIVLRDGAGEVTAPYVDVEVEMTDLLNQWRDIRDEQQQPKPIGHGTTPSPWSRYATQIIRKREDLTLLPGVGAKKADKWRSRGITSLKKIVEAGAQGCEERLQNSHCYYHALAYRAKQPIFRPGESAEILRRKRLVYFDVEDTSVLESTIVTRPHTYMLGVATLDGDTVIWTSHGETDEARMWEKFLDWLGPPEDVALYCWTMYESKKIGQAASRHSQLADRLMAANESLIDLKEEIKHRPYFPVSSYSIKEVAPVCGFDWSQEDVDGQTAQLMYIDWLKTGDDSIIRRVEQYNREDVLAMVAVDRYICEMSGC
jgi:predicted RecB family nuclease